MTKPSVFVDEAIPDVMIRLQFLLVKPLLDVEALDEGLVGMAVGGVRRVQATDFLAR